MSKSFYPRSTEPSMRDELINTFDGRFPEVAKRQVGLLRKMRRDSSGNLIKCDCVDSVTQEADKDTFCPLCHGEGNKWDEKKVELYRVQVSAISGQGAVVETISPGLLNIQSMNFYLKYSENVTEEDKLILLVTDGNGDPSLPLTRKAKFRIGQAIEMRSDNGRLEFWKVATYQEKVKYLNG